MIRQAGGPLKVCTTTLVILTMREVAPHNTAGYSEAHTIEGTTRRRQQRIRR